MDRLYTLCVWAGWRKAQTVGAIPTIDAIWGTEGFSAGVYHDPRTNEMIVATESPGQNWAFYGWFNGGVSDTSKRLTSGIHLTGLAVDQVLRDRLGRTDLRQILYILPVAGKYQGEFWSDDHKITGVLSDTDTLRDINRTAKGESEQTVLRLCSAALSSSAIRSAVKELERHAAIVPDKFKPQLEIQFCA